MVYIPVIIVQDEYILPVIMKANVDSKVSHVNKLISIIIHCDTGSLFLSTVWSNQ